MAWEKNLKRWKNGKVADERTAEVESWLRNDPVWSHWSVRIIWPDDTDRRVTGSHQIVVEVKGMNHVSPKWWGRDRFQLSTCDGGRGMEGWIVKELLKAHKWISEYIASGEDLGPS